MHIFVRAEIEIFWPFVIVDNIFCFKCAIISAVNKSKDRIDKSSLRLVEKDSAFIPLKDGEFFLNFFVS